MYKKIKVRVESTNSGRVDEFETTSFLMSAMLTEECSEDEKCVRSHMMGYLTEENMITIFAGLINTVEKEIGADEVPRFLANALMLASTKFGKGTRVN